MICLKCRLDSSQYQFLSMDYQPHMTNQFVKHSEIAGVIRIKQKFRLHPTRPTYPTRPNYPTLPVNQTNQPIRTKPFICRDLNCNKLYSYCYVINFVIFFYFRSYGLHHIKRKNVDFITYGFMFTRLDLRFQQYANVCFPWVC